MTGVAVVGCGYWGPNVARNLSALEECRLRGVFDLDRSRAERLQRSYPAARVAAGFEELLEDPTVDALALCTPVETHYPLARAALEAGKHVLVEKPLTDSARAATELVALAEARGRVLQVDHTFVYSGAVQRIRSLVESGQLGDLLYIDSVRINLGLFQTGVNVIWDLAPHDVSIMTYLLGRPARWVSAVGRAH